MLLRADGVGGEAREGSGEPYSLVGVAISSLYSSNLVPVVGAQQADAVQSLQCLQGPLGLDVHDESDYPEGEF